MRSLPSSGVTCNSVERSGLEQLEGKRTDSAKDMKKRPESSSVHYWNLLACLFVFFFFFFFLYNPVLIYVDPLFLHRSTPLPSAEILILSFGDWSRRFCAFTGYFLSRNPIPEPLLPSDAFQPILGPGF